MSQPATRKDHVDVDKNFLLRGALTEAFGLTPPQSNAALAVVQRVLEVDGLPLGPRSADFSLVVAEGLGLESKKSAVSVPLSLSALFPAKETRRTLVDTLVIAACMEGDVTVARQTIVATIARELGVVSPWSDLLGALRQRRVLAVKLALVRRAPDARRVLERVWREEGMLGLLRALLFVFGGYQDAALAARYRALKDLPPGSFGRAVSDHFEARGLRFPGEKGGLPERMMHHDLLHVINGYDTDPAGECELAGFYAGCATADAFTFIVIALATFHLGLPVSPAAVRPAHGEFVPRRVLAAFLRGRRLRVDVMGSWDYWSLLPFSLEQARTLLGLGGEPLFLSEQGILIVFMQRFLWQKAAFQREHPLSAESGGVMFFQCRP